MDSAFDALSSAGQIARLRRLARNALPAYGLEGARLSVLHHAHNTTFRVDAVAPPGRCVLRVHRAGYRNDAEIASELLWLAALRRESEIVVPEPIPTRTGEWVTIAEAPGVPEARQVTLLGWTTGRFLRRRIVPRVLERVGRLTARLHEHARGWTPPPGFTRRRWDMAGLGGPSLGVDGDAARAALTPDARAVTGAAATKLEEILSAYGEAPDRWGLIHADLHLNNCLFADGEARAIDFDDCGWGYFAYDLATTLSTLRHRHNYAALRDGLFTGYTQIRPLPPQTGALLDPLMAARDVAFVLYVAAHRAEPMFAPWAASFIETRIEGLRAFCAHAGGNAA